MTVPWAGPDILVTGSRAWPAAAPIEARIPTETANVLKPSKGYPRCKIDRCSHRSGQTEPGIRFGKLSRKMVTNDLPPLF
jgi:hypothetical protein